MTIAHGRAWRNAARSPAVAVELESVYAEVAREVAERGPACWASGRCCNFDRTGHRLYVTGLEAAYAVERLPPGVTLDADAVAGAVAHGGCPFQVGNLCGIHGVRPLGCRVYFCDRGAQEWQHELTERMLDRIRRLHDRHGVPYIYAEWRSLLSAAVDARTTTSGGGPSSSVAGGDGSGVGRVRVTVRGRPLRPES